MTPPAIGGGNTSASIGKSRSTSPGHEEQQQQQHPSSENVSASDGGQQQQQQHDGGGAKKTAKLTTIDKQSDSGRRLVEYFVVVSSIEVKQLPPPPQQQQPHATDDWVKKDPKKSGNSSSSADDNDANISFQDWRTESHGTDDATEADLLEKFKFRPTITARYPVTDHHDNPLHENVTFFCHPTGGIQLRTEQYMPKVHYFVATGGTGKQMYGTCLTLWEPYKLQLTMDDVADAKTSAATGKNSKTKTPKAGNNSTAVANNKMTTRLVFLPKCLVLLSTYPYLAAFREYLSQLHRLSKLGEMTLPLERYIVNFCSEIPAPPPGSFEVQTTILDSVIKIWSPPHNLPIAWVSLPFHLLFECLDIHNIILTWHCLALERQVLITSTQLSILTIASEIFLSLLFPMRWSHAYIPVLPTFLIPILSAPMPFLCGINKANLADALYDLSRECVLVDLDKNTVTLGPDTVPLPPLPPVQEASLRTNLQQNVGMVFREARSLTKNDDYSDSGTRLPSHVKMMAEAMWESKLCLYDEAFHLTFTPEEARKNLLNGNDTSGMDVSERDAATAFPLTIYQRETSGPIRKQSCWDAVQEAFLDTFVYLLRNYRKYLVFPSKHNEGSYGGAGFRSKEFLESQRYDMREFLEQFILTQMFDNFITKRLYGSGEPDVAFFDMAVDRFLKNAGIFADVDLQGRLLGKSSAAIGADKRNSLSGMSGGPLAAEKSRGVSILARAASRATSTATRRASGTSSGNNDVDPLLQSARVHRKLKTIVPPEPTGEGLPDNLAEVIRNEQQQQHGDLYFNDHDGYDDADDNQSVESSGTAGTHGTRKSSASANTPGSPRASSYPRSLKAAGAAKGPPRYTYPTFPSKFHTELFGTPRPLPAAVIAEFDRQRKDAAQFRRKGSNMNNNSSIGGGSGKNPLVANSKLHIKRANATTLEAIVPPSAEVATFTVFFMAFTAMVGKELIDMAQNEQQEQGQERTILSTYVPTTADDSYDDNSTTGLTSSGDEDGDEDAGTDVVDEKEKEDVAEMKTSRPSMGRMFGDDDDDADAASTGRSHKSHSSATKEQARSSSGSSNSMANKKVNGTGNKTSNRSQSFGDNKSTKSVDSRKSSDNNKPRERFRDKLSDLQIEEAKATGRAQLGLAFEMLTMMKKRALKADPEAYQCLIDACGRVGDTKRATELLGKMHEDGIVADGTVYACLVSAFSAETPWKSGAKQEELPEWANSTAVEMDWNKLQKRSFLDRLVGQVVDLDDDDQDEEGGEGIGAYRKLKNRLLQRRKKETKPLPGPKVEETKGMEFFVTEAVERQIALGENLLEIVFPDISIDTEDEVCPRCNFVLSDDDVVDGWTPGDSNDYTTACSNCTKRFVPHFCVQSSAPTFMGSRGPASPLMCERLSPWVLQKEIRSVMSDQEGIQNLLNPEWREKEYKNGVLWWNLVLSCMRYRFPFTFLLQGSFDQNLIAPMPEDDS